MVAEGEYETCIYVHTSSSTAVSYYVSPHPIVCQQRLLPLLLSDLAHQKPELRGAQYRASPSPPTLPAGPPPAAEQEVPPGVSVSPAPSPEPPQQTAHGALPSSATLTPHRTPPSSSAATATGLMPLAVPLEVLVVALGGE